MGDCAEGGKQELLLEKEDSQGGASFGALMLRPSDSASIPVGLRAYPHRAPGTSPKIDVTRAARPRS